jgi:hypothetical protein
MFASVCEILFASVYVCQCLHVSVSIVDFL